MPTSTYATLEISQAAWDELAERLHRAGEHYAGFVNGKVIHWGGEVGLVVRELVVAADRPVFDEGRVATMIEKWQQKEATIEEVWPLVLPLVDALMAKEEIADPATVRTQIQAKLPEWLGKYNRRKGMSYTFLLTHIRIFLYRRE